MDAEDVYERNRRTQLKKYIRIANKLHEAAEAVLDHRLTEEQAVETYKISENYLTKKTKYLKLQRKFDEQSRNYTRAVTYVVTGMWTVSQAVAECRVTSRILKQEIEMAQFLGLETYCFDRPVNYSQLSSWTYLDEEYILEQLKIWRDSREGTRFSQYRIYKKLSRIAYVYASMCVTYESISYPQIWDRYEQTTVAWLEGFDMRHHDKIKNIFAM